MDMGTHQMTQPPTLQPYRIERRSDAFWLGMANAIILALLLAFLIVIAWRTNAVMLMRRDAPIPTPAATVAPL